MFKKYKACHAIKAFTVSGESAGVDLQTVDDFRSRIPEICSLFFFKFVLLYCRHWYCNSWSNP